MREKESKTQIKRIQQSNVKLACLAFPRGAFHKQGLQVRRGAEAEEADGGEEGGVGRGRLGVGVGGEGGSHTVALLGGVVVVPGGVLRGCLGVGRWVREGGEGEWG